MTEYLLSVFMPTDYEDVDVTPEQIQGMVEAVDRFNQQLQDAGAWVFAGGLHPPATATVVDATGDKVLTTDGPYAEAKEHIGGFWIIRVDDLDAALEWARRGSAACAGKVEVRPFQDESEG